MKQSDETSHQGHAPSSPANAGGLTRLFATGAGIFLAMLVALAGVTPRAKDDAGYKAADSTKERDH